MNQVLIIAEAEENGGLYYYVIAGERQSRKFYLPGQGRRLGGNPYGIYMDGVTEFTGWNSSQVKLVVATVSSGSIRDN